MNIHKNHKNKMIIGAIVVAALVFFVGMKYGQTTGGTASNQTSARTGGYAGAGGGARATRSGGGIISGSVIAVDATSMTVKLNDNTGNRIIFFGASTPIMKSVSGTAADLVVGKTVMVTGQPNTDGSINAQSVQIRDVLVK